MKTFMGTSQCLSWYEKLYRKHGYRGQRSFPNEELIRFLGRSFGSLPPGRRKSICVLEVGCGSGGNLWALSREGFNTTGLDISNEALSAGRALLKKWGARASLVKASMTALPFQPKQFDVVVDVFSSYCLPWKDFEVCLDEINRVLKKGGLFYSYSPSTASTAFKNHNPSRKIDPWTLNGIHRKTSPYHGNFYPFRFISPVAYKNLLTKNGFKVPYLEEISKTYSGLKERFAFVSVVGIKK